DYPAAKEWPTFDGEGEYNHLEFIKWVDKVADKMGMPDKLIEAKLTIVFEGVAREGLFEVMDEEGDNMTWAECKEAIQNRFGTEPWRERMEQSFNKNKFNPNYHNDIVKWATKQKQKLKAFAPDISKKKIIDRILWKTPGDIRNNVLSRIGDNDTWTKFLCVIEDITKNTSIGKK
ncbi:hypothetical protein CROQUDRAFT_21138, partial [Cronartium quercuum f. sp. fusiforme G11]